MENTMGFIDFGADGNGDAGRVVGARPRGPSVARSIESSDSVLAPPPPAPRPRSNKGFTLLEMLAVIVLLGIVGVIVARSVSGRVDTGKWDAGKIGVTKLDQDVQAYALDNGSPPKGLDDLITKPLNAPSWNGPYAKPADLTDPFRHPYGYVYPGKHGQYDVLFYGRDGKPGGEGIDRDYGNWQ
jgi:general secretion pathway protein G